MAAQSGQFRVGKWCRIPAQLLHKPALILTCETEDVALPCKRSQANSLRSGQGRRPGSVPVQVAAKHVCAHQGRGSPPSPSFKPITTPRRLRSAGKRQRLPYKNRALTIPAQMREGPSDLFDGGQGQNLLCIREGGEDCGKVFFCVQGVFNAKFQETVRPHRAASAPCPPYARFVLS